MHGEIHVIIQMNMVIKMTTKSELKDIITKYGSEIDILLDDYKYVLAKKKIEELIDVMKDYIEW